MMAQVEVHHGRAVLQVLAFAENVGRDQNIQPFLGRYRVLFLVARGAEPPCRRGGVLAVAGHGLGFRNALGPKPVRDVFDRVRELAEDQHLLVRAFGADQPQQAQELAVPLRTPLAAALQDPEQIAGIAQKILGQLGPEQPGRQPAETPLHLAAVDAVYPRCPLSKNRLGPCGPLGFVILCIAVVLAGEQSAVVVAEAGVESRGVLRPDGNGLVVLQRMEEDEVAQDVPLDGQQEGLPAAFQPLEEIRAAEAHQPLAGAGKIGDDKLLGGGQRLGGLFVDVVPQSVARQLEVVDGVDDRVGIEKRVLVAGVAVVDLEPNRFRRPPGEIRSGAVGERQKLAARLVLLRVVFLDEAPGAADQEQPHQLAPVVGVLAFLEGGERADGALMLVQKLRFP